jgi:hypothetical protein
MAQTFSIQRSPLQAWHQARCDDWCQLGDTSLPRHFTESASEMAAAAELALCDLSGSPLVEIKGPSASLWLTTHDLPIPQKIYDVTRLDERAWILRTGGDEFLLRGLPGATIAELTPHLPPAGFHDRILTTHRQDALLLLSGSRLAELISQTCALDFNQLETDRVYLSRVATVNCGLMKDRLGTCPVCWLWVDPSYSLDLWSQLVQIVDELGGQVIGAGCFYPELG